jgi:hypothetical protein
MTLDDLFGATQSNIRLIKIDIEGYELEALKGAKELLTRRQFDNLLIEIHHHALEGLNQSERMIDELLECFGYKKTKVSSNLSLYSAN